MADTSASGQQPPPPVQPSARPAHSRFTSFAHHCLIIALPAPCLPAHLPACLQKVPSIDIPLHTVMELTPRADGTMAETRFIVDVDKAIADMAAMAAAAGDCLTPGCCARPPAAPCPWSQDCCTNASRCGSCRNGVAFAGMPQCMLGTWGQPALVSVGLVAPTCCPGGVQSSWLPPSFRARHFHSRVLRLLWLACWHLPTPHLPACLLPSAPTATGDDTSSLSSSPDRHAVHFDLLSAGGSGGAEGRPHFKRSLSMAELAAAALVREEEVRLLSQDSVDATSLMAAMAAAGQEQQQQQQQQQQEDQQRGGS